MRWKRFVKQALDHPYFDDRRHTLSQAQAEDILRSGYMGCGEFMEGVRRRVDGIERGLREPVDPGLVLPNQTRRRRGKPAAPAWSGWLRGLALAGATALLAVFFVFTSPGRAVAQAVYRAVVSVADGTLRGRQTVPDNDFDKIDIDDLPAEFSSAEEARQWIPLPIAEIESEQYESRGIRVLHADEISVTLTTQYADENGSTIALIQDFFAPGTSWGNAVSADARGVAQLELPGGLTAYTGTMDDGTSFAVVYLSEGFVTLASAGLSVDALGDVLEGFKLE